LINTLNKCRLRAGFPCKAPLLEKERLPAKLMLEISDSDQQGLYRSKSRGKTGNENQGELQWQA